MIKDIADPEKEIESLNEQRKNRLTLSVNFKDLLRISEWASAYRCLQEPTEQDLEVMRKIETHVKEAE
jgi:hypothetical protein